MKRKIFASKEMSDRAAISGGKIEIYSFFPIDRFSCGCQQTIHEWKEKLAMLSGSGKEEAVLRQEFIVCPRSKAGMKRYQVSCKNCNEVQGYCWATDKTLTDWCDFHYVNWNDGEQWYGCLSPHISPITEQLCLECACGYDTRDFRLNMTLPGKVAYEIEKKNKIGRDFGKADSKFNVSVVADDVVIFKEKNG